MNNELYHYGVLGMKWGVRRYQPYGTGGYARKGRKIFVSGSSKTGDADSAYYRKELPAPLVKELKKHIDNNDYFLIGDAPGIDSQVQDYLNKINYKNVKIYTVSKEPRYLANSKWIVKNVESNNRKDSKEWLRDKDIAMTRDADQGISVVIENGSSATRNNIRRLLEQNKGVKIFELGENDRSISVDEFMKSMSKRKII